MLFFFWGGECSTQGFRTPAEQEPPSVLVRLTPLNQVRWAMNVRDCTGCVVRAA